MKNFLDDIDLSRHTIVQASAGTGKTYTLLQLVRRLLLENDVTLDQILLVTYTEKATGEIKQRLVKMLAEDASANPKMREALQHVDQASVFTIHGFCQRILQEFAFENRQDFQPQLVDDKELLQICLRELQRKHWRAEYGDQLTFLLNLAGYAGRDGQTWESRVLDLAARLRPECGHRLAPAAMDDFVVKLAECRDRSRSILDQIRELAEPFDNSAFLEHRWMTGYVSLTVNNKKLQSRPDKYLKPILQWMTSPISDQQPLLSFLRLLRPFNNWELFRKRGFPALIDGFAAKLQPEIPKRCPQLQEALEALDELRSGFDWSQMENQLAVRTVHALQSQLFEWKREQGRQSFQDMLSRMDEGLDPERNPGAALLVEELRKRYRFAVVDEFQDTDPLQWRIFKHIFVDGDGTRLFVVGDPKQAIYGFRGADFMTYETAVKSLQSEHGGELCHLDVNWRSCDELIYALNHLFKDGEWFLSPIEYIDVHPAPKDNRPYGLTADHTKRSALTAVKYSDDLTASDVRKRHAVFIADEIARLISLNPAMAFRSKIDEKSRALNAGDIAILVRKRSEADPVMEALNNYGIPYTFYKQGGLWQSEEAAQLRCVLRALAEPNDESAFRRLLLTRFFGIGPIELAQADEIPHNHPARGLFGQWVEYSAKRRWSAVFQSLWDDTLLRYSDDANSDRQLANMRHLTASLEHFAHENNSDALGLLNEFAQRRRHPPREDADVEPVDSDQEKVRFLTIHASKGLEFPIVFLAGGYTASRASEVYQYHDGDNVVLHLPPSDEAKRLAKLEDEHEMRRLMYVALTRAIFKLYVPYAPKLKRGGGPVTSLLGRALSVLHTLPSPPEGLWQFIDANVDRPSVVPAKKRGAPIVESIKLPAVLFPRIDDKLRSRRREIQSFSKIHQKLTSHDPEPTAFPEQLARSDDDQPDSLSQGDQLRGPIFGDMVHALLETADFYEVGQADGPTVLLRKTSTFRRLLDEELNKNAVKMRSPLSRTELEKQCREEIARLVWTTLRTPLSPIGQPLWQVPPKDRLHEVEFLSHHTGSEYFTGFIDVVVRYQGRYFIVDYKTNVLSAYDRDTIYNSIKENDYERQFRIYLQALAKWLKKATKDFNWQRDIGGVFYLYVRGLNGKDDSTGVYFHEPTSEDLQVNAVLPAK